MEAVSEKRGSNSMKSKLMMSFYRAAKPQPATTVKPPPPAVFVKTTSFRNDGMRRSDDGYSHGPDGGGGDRHVDKKATSYISHVKERLRLEELDLVLED